MLDDGGQHLAGEQLEDPGGGLDRDAVVLASDGRSAVDDLTPQEVDRHQQAVEGHEARQQALQTEGNANVKNYTETNNAKLKERKDRLYSEAMSKGRADLNKSKEVAMAAIYSEKQQHALACKKLMASNPYPVNSSQFNAVKTSCAGEDSRNLDNATLWRPGSHDGGSGPNGGLAGSKVGQRGEGPYEESPPAGANGTSWFSQGRADETEAVAVQDAGDEDLQEETRLTET